MSPSVETPQLACAAAPYTPVQMRIPGTPCPTLPNTPTTLPGTPFRIPGTPGSVVSAASSQRSGYVVISNFRKGANMFPRPYNIFHGYQS